ncbi:hypothetical protein [Ligilactobacillus aviarius]|uniref:hypothetical protein n=1 Tax=Ligilactobacillus aviarius TaxID=1606 RepID=UPI00255BE7C5|nr:hypothetical protein [Ligilactobacillus aviarius]
MSKNATNTMCKVETAIFLIAIVSGIISTKLAVGCWVTFLATLLIHMILDKSYLEEWCDWLWQK